MAVASAGPTPRHSISAGQMLRLMPNQQCQSTEGKVDSGHTAMQSIRCSLLLHTQRGQSVCWSRQLCKTDELIAIPFGVRTRGGPMYYAGTGTESPSPHRKGTFGGGYLDTRVAR